jgi:hypothetical protein
MRLVETKGQRELVSTLEISLEILMTKDQMRRAFLEMCRMYGRRAKGKPKTMSKAAIRQRKAAGKASAIAREFYLKQTNQTKEKQQP